MAPVATAAEAIAALARSGQTVATCESITGGLICGELTQVPGASDVVRGGLVTYATDLKTSLAGVEPAVIADHGVVSAAVARAMAAGARAVCRADWGIAVTGVAGPGPSGDTAPGTVWLGVVGPGVDHAVRLSLDGDRQQVRQGVVDQSITWLCALLDG
jgi:nicotinamide-nucleotide amidase